MLNAGVWRPSRVGGPVAPQPMPHLSSIWSRCAAAAPIISSALSANTRQQLRRSDRAYAAMGPLALHRADSISEAHQFLDSSCGVTSGALDRPRASRRLCRPIFSPLPRRLIERGFPRGEIDLLCATAGGQVIGYLYNFRYRGQALAYQSGFDYLSRRQAPKAGPDLPSRSHPEISGRWPGSL